MPDATMQQPHDLLLHELSRMYVFEQQQRRDADRPRGRGPTPRRPANCSRHHLKETREQLGLLEECFALLDARPQPVTVSDLPLG